MQKLEHEVKAFDRSLRKAIEQPDRNQKINDYYRVAFGLGIAAILGLGGMFVVAFFMRALTAPTIVNPPPPPPVEVDCPWIGSCNVGN